MTKEEKELLIKDLCARLPYGVFVKDRNRNVPVKCDLDCHPNLDDLENIKTYLRPMSSMTEEEIEELKKLSSGVVWRKDVLHDIVLDIWYNTDSIDWLISNHFDYRGLIPMGLALEATEDMYK